MLSVSEKRYVNEYNINMPQELTDYVPFCIDKDYSELIIKSDYNEFIINICSWELEDGECFYDFRITNNKYKKNHHLYKVEDVLTKVEVYGRQNNEDLNIYLDIFILYFKDRSPISILFDFFLNECHIFDEKKTNEYMVLCTEKEIMYSLIETIG